MKLTGRQTTANIADLRLAIFFLLCCWDVLSRVEDEVGFDIEVDHLSGIASDLELPQHALTLSMKDIRDGINCRLTPINERITK